MREAELEISGGNCTIPHHPESLEKLSDSVDCFKVKNKMNLGLEFEITWLDETFMQFRVSGSNGIFGGGSHIYGTFEEFKNFASLLKGFPTTSGDRREYEAGSFTQENAEGGLKISFSCTDSIGHIEARVVVKENGAGSERKPDFSEFSLKIEPASIDRFVESLEQIQIKIGAKSVLSGAT